MDFKKVLQILRMSYQIFLLHFACNFFSNPILLFIAFSLYCVRKRSLFFYYNS